TRFSRDWSSDVCSSDLPEKDENDHYWSGYQGETQMQWRQALGQEHPIAGIAGGLEDARYSQNTKYRHRLLPLRPQHQQNERFGQGSGKCQYTNDQMQHQGLTMQQKLVIARRLLLQARQHGQGDGGSGCVNLIQRQHGELVG